ncbi:MAG: glycosyltransferase family 39 protein, partial [Acidobacteria bacterium]|nr:glycosyltransferase family 39 protein [Acidobacteriota bacterium]
FWAGIVLATCAGMFLFTRILIPDVILTLAITVALWSFLRALDAAEPRPRLWAAVMAAAVGAGLLLKGLVAALIPMAAGLLYLAFTRQLAARRTWQRLRPFSGALIVAGVAAPWHVAAILRNPPYFDFTMRSEPVAWRGFFWFYFLNEHVFRFLNIRHPRDYNTVPRLWFWLLHLLWLFPWSAFLPAAARLSYRATGRAPVPRPLIPLPAPPRPEGARHPAPGRGSETILSRARKQAEEPNHAVRDLAGRARLLALCWTGFVLVFFTFSTTQEYYSMPCYPALALLIGSAIAEEGAWIRRGVRVVAVIAALAACLIGGLLIAVRGLPTPGDIAGALAQNPEAYTLSLGHMGDLTLESFAYLRLPLALAGVAMLVGVAAWRLPLRRALPALALMMVLFLHAARLAMVVFDPYLGSRPLAEALLRAPPGATDRRQPVLHLVFRVFLRQPARAAAERALEQPGVRLPRSRRAGRVHHRPGPAAPVEGAAALLSAGRAPVGWAHRGTAGPARPLCSGLQRRQIPVFESSGRLRTSKWNSRKC